MSPMSLNETFHLPADSDMICPFDRLSAIRIK
jgi:hypothetical protein